MRYYLDTNTVIFVIFDKNNDDNIDNNVLSILQDYENMFFVSSVSIREIIHLVKINKIRHHKFKTAKEILKAIELLNYEIKPVTTPHLYTYCDLIPVLGHNDPNDHLIISQAISDKIPVISSDGKFKFYENQGLQLVFNKR